MYKIYVGIRILSQILQEAAVHVPLETTTDLGLWKHVETFA